MNKYLIVTLFFILTSSASIAQTDNTEPVHIDKKTIDSVEVLIDQKEKSLMNASIDPSVDLEQAKKELNEKVAQLEQARTTLEKLKLKDVIDPKEIKALKSSVKDMKKDVRHTSRKVKRKAKIVSTAAKAL